MRESWNPFDVSACPGNDFTVRMQLASLVAVGVDLNGKVDMTPGAGGLISYTFYSASQAELMHGGNVATASKAKCKVTINMAAGRTMTFVQSGRCDRPTVRLPRCSAKSIAARARAAGFTAGRMTLAYAPNLKSGVPYWNVSGMGIRSIPDDC